MAPETDNLSEASFEDLGTVEEATADDETTLAKSADAKSNRDLPAEVVGDEAQAQNTSDEDKSDSDYEDADDFADLDWAPTNDIHFVVRWENYEGNVEKEMRSLRPFAIQLDPEDDTRSEASLMDDCYGGDRRIPRDTCMSIPRLNRCKGTELGTTEDATGSTQHLDSMLENDSGSIENSSDFDDEPTGTPVLEFCATLSLANTLYPPPPRPGYGFNHKPKAKTYDLRSSFVTNKYVRIHSPHLVNALRAVTEYYPHINLNNVPVTIPYRSCYLGHIFRDLQAYKVYQRDHHDEEYADTVSKHIDLLLDLIEDDFEDQMEQSEMLQGKGKTTFDTVWTLLKPGTEAYFYDYSAHKNVTCIVHSMAPAVIGPFWTSSVDSYIVQAWRIIWYKGKFHRESHTFSIYSFPGECDISQLAVFPARFLPQNDSEPCIAEATLGRFCWTIAAKGGPCYLELSDDYEFEGEYKKPLQPSTFMNSRLIVDYFHDLGRDHFGNFSPLPPGVHPLGRHQPLDGPRVHKAEFPKNLAYCRCLKCDIGSKDRHRSIWANLDELDPVTDVRPVTSKYYYAMEKNMPSWLFATQRHVLINAKYVGFIGRTLQKSEVVHSSPEVSEIFDGITKSFVPQQMLPQIPDSAPQGVNGGHASRIILLHGSPGTGKTATVEQLAETTHRPLFYLDYPLSRHAPGRSGLNEILSICERTGGIALIDDAERSFGRRSSMMDEASFVYTGLARDLDSFNCTIFLTTNRLAQMDPAFLCRISMAVHFPALSDEQRHKIWTNHFSALAQPSNYSSSIRSGGLSRRVYVSPQTRAFVFEDKEVASLKWNGFEIRNALRSAIWLAESETMASNTHTAMPAPYYRRPARRIPGYCSSFGASPPLAPPVAGGVPRRVASAPHNYPHGLSSAANVAESEREKPSIIALEQHFKIVVRNALQFREHLNVAGVNDGLVG
ncbi:hypothetical protein MKZ38_009920 [Zalerion maritima]|uniref:AAA+ ATPase domain-containing protein n=1 Tax=Zalerion maritima TaxID=339359 RepID=A0AAD5RU08_9PEZI|nr:hypothetical protein MKZ38_009920 [Zalerion maritima]